MKNNRLKYLELDNLLFFYELYLSTIDEENHLQWSLILDVRTKISKELRKFGKIDSDIIKRLNILDKELKGKALLLNKNERSNLIRLRKVRYSKPPKSFWWYYLDSITDKITLSKEHHRKKPRKNLVQL